MLNEGYVRLFRSITSWEWYDDIPTFRVFTHLLLTCNWQEGKWRGHTIRPGQRVISLAKLAEETGMSMKAVRTALERLETAQSLARSKIGKVGLITIKNWDKYQGRGTIIGTETATKGHGKGTERATNEESKKAIKQEVPPYSPPTGDGFDEFWAAYPKKKSKGAARKAWDKLKPSPEMRAKILHSIERAKQSADWLEADGKYIPYPATWLNAEGWEDGVEEEKPREDPGKYAKPWPEFKPGMSWEDLIP